MKKTISPIVILSLLADVMAPEAKKFKSTLFIHPKRDAYNELLGKIGGKRYK